MTTGFHCWDTRFPLRNVTFSLLWSCGGSMHVGASPNLCSVSTREFHLPGPFFKYPCHRWCVPAMSRTYQLLSLSASVCSSLCCPHSVSVYEPDMFTRWPSSHRGHHCVRVRYFAIINPPFYLCSPGDRAPVSLFPFSLTVCAWHPACPPLRPPHIYAIINV